MRLALTYLYQSRGFSCGEDAVRLKPQGQTFSLEHLFIERDQLQRCKGRQKSKNRTPLSGAKTTKPE